MKKLTWFDRALANVAPRWQLRRLRARVALDLLARHYEAASTGRRTQGWTKTGADANAVIGAALGTLREHARDLVRNNGYAESALSTIADHTVGWGITAKPVKPKGATNVDKRNQAALEAWHEWADSTACDADGRHDFYGLQKLVMRTVVESGECLVRPRRRLPEDKLPFPLQLQVIEPDFLDTSKDTPMIERGRPRIVQGVEFDAIGRRVAYWLFPEHPGSIGGGVNASVRVPAEQVWHIFRSMRPGQVRGITWFAPVTLRFKDFDEYEDATLMKQKIAACLAVITSDADGSATPLGVEGTNAADPNGLRTDNLGPGAVVNAAPGRTIDVVTPPQVNDYDAYTQNNLRAIATGLGVTVEDLTGNYQNMPFSAARMSRLRHQARVHDWRWRILIPQFCEPAWRVLQETAIIANRYSGEAPVAEWTPPPLPAVDPDKEGRATTVEIRSGLKSWSEAIRERGRDPNDVRQEIADDNAAFDALGILLDSDPRKMTQAGQTQGTAKGKASTTSAAGGDEDNDEDIDDDVDETDEGEDEERKRGRRRAPWRPNGHV